METVIGTRMVAETERSRTGKEIITVKNREVLNFRSITNINKNRAKYY